MSSRKELVPCPNCGAVVDCELYETLDAGLDPALGELLLANKLSRLVCPDCNHDAPIAHDLTYVDSKRNLVVRVEVDEQATADELAKLAAGAPGATLRRVKSRNDLVEKILLRDAGLDDRVIEGLKFTVIAQNHELLDYDVLFDGKEGDELAFAAVNDAGAKGFTLPMDAYGEIHDGLAQQGLLAPSKEFQRVDRIFGAKLVQKLAGMSDETAQA